MKCEMFRETNKLTNAGLEQILKTKNQIIIKNMWKTTAKIKLIMHSLTLFPFRSFGLTHYKQLSVKQKIITVQMFIIVIITRTNTVVKHITCLQWIHFRFFLLELFFILKCLHVSRKLMLLLGVLYLTCNVTTFTYYIHVNVCTNACMYVFNCSCNCLNIWNYEGKQS